MVVGLGGAENIRGRANAVLSGVSILYTRCNFELFGSLASQALWEGSSRMTVQLEGMLSVNIGISHELGLSAGWGGPATQASNQALSGRRYIWLLSFTHVVFLELS